MRIGVNALYLIPGGVGGTEIYLRSLLRALARIDRENRYTIFTNRETAGEITPNAPNFETHRTGVPGRVRPARVLYEQLALPFAARGCDVLWNPGFTAPLLAPEACVTVFHDLQHKTLPQHFRWFELPFWNFFLWGSVRRARKLIAVTEFTRGDVLRFYQVDPAKVHVVPHGVDDEFGAIAERRARGGAAELSRELLCVSTLHPHKNLTALVRVFARFHAAHPGFRLTLAGMRGFAASEVDAEVARLGLSEWVRVTGWIPRGELLRLFERAWAFVYPSTFEGFGMPVLEAMAAGIPTVASSIPALREVAGEAALLVDPAKEDDLLAALESACFDEGVRSRLVQAGPRRAERFSWTAAAEQTLGVLRAAAQGH
jgi:glycosyltransferase involved in cell wall biosynthesis